ncbi:MAG: polysaccharide biosynthesis/export family protein [Pseudomonadota bacterium]
MRLLSYLILISIVSISSSCTSIGSPASTSASKVEIENSKEVINNVSVAEFTLGPGDELEISVWRHGELNKTVTIGPSGVFSYPLVGDINANSISIIQLRDIVKEKLSKYYVNPQVSVSVKSARSLKVFVLGEVTKPGVFQMGGPMSALEAISQAGGFTKDAKKKSVLLIRGSLSHPDLKVLNIDQVLKKGDLKQNVALQSSDIIYVPASFIANVDRFFNHLNTILEPIVDLERGITLYPEVESVLTTGKGRGGVIIPR